MHLVKFRIKYYKSIIDSGNCDVEQDMTIFAGKNETGKSSILQALNDFNQESEFSQEVYPVDDQDKKPELSLWFQLDKTEKTEFNKQFQTKLTEESEVVVGITKTTSGYTIINENLEPIGAHENNKFVLSPERLKLLLSFIPNFILFSSFDDIIPNEIPESQIRNNSFMQDFSKISGLDLNILTSKHVAHNMQHKDQVNIQINKDYNEYWIQDDATIRVDWNGNIVYVCIVEGGHYFSPSQRSKGKQWHLSFYIRIKARTMEGRRNILLIDEPGLYLHASAQQDVYKMLLSYKDKAQVLYTTHSPYLIKQDELNRIRLVTKTDPDKNGTKIGNKIHAGADKETLTPILTAIGLKLNEGIQFFERTINVVVEGPSDCLYFHTISKILGEKSVNFIFGGGSGNMGIVGSILTGWGCKVIYLFDNDQGFKDGARNLTRNWKVMKEQIKASCKQNGQVEDLFSPDDFSKFVLCDQNKSLSGDISNYIKVNKLDKVMLARRFSQEHANGNVNLSEITMKNFKLLFDDLSKD